MSSGRFTATVCKGTTTICLSILKRHTSLDSNALKGGFFVTPLHQPTHGIL